MAHFYALTKEGKLVSALEAIGGVDHFCPHCHATMRVRKSITRLPHFFLLDDSHKSRDCKEIEKERNTIRSPTLLNQKIFCRSVMVPKARNRNTEYGSNARKKISHSGKEMLPPNSIRQLIACGARSMNPSTPIENGIISDVYIGPKAYNQCIQADTHLGFRVVDLWMNSALDGRIRYVANWTYLGELHRSFFEHRVDESINFEALANELFHERREYNGHPIWTKPKYKAVAVAGEWTAVGHQHCRKLCNFCRNARRTCRGMWTSPLYHLGQIYYSDLPENRF